MPSYASRTFARRTAADAGFRHIRRPPESPRTPARTGVGFGLCASLETDKTDTPRACARVEGPTLATSKRDRPCEMHAGHCEHSRTFDAASLRSDLTLGRAGLAGEQARIDAFRLERSGPRSSVGVSNRILRSPGGEPAVTGHLLVELALAPAGIAERRDPLRRAPALRDRAQHVDRSGHREHRPSGPATCSVSCPPQSLEWRMKPRPGSTGPP